MAIKGQQLKTEIAQKILNLFGDNAFFYNDGKEIRINGLEDGQPVQIKIALTASKVAVENGSDNALPAATAVSSASNRDFEDLQPTPAAPVEPTVEEKENIKMLMQRLGL